MSFLSTFSSALTKARTSATPLTDQLQTRLGAQVQTPLETIDKLVERIQTSPNVEDRRTAVLGLKGCCREYKEAVGDRSLPSLLAVLQYDAPQDGDIAKAVLETLMGVLEVGEKPNRDDPGLRFQDVFFQTPEPTHSLLTILQSSPSFYPRFYTLQLLSLLLTHNSPSIQSYILSSPPPGVDALLSVLSPFQAQQQQSHDPANPMSGPNPNSGGGMTSSTNEMIRNEFLLLLPLLVSGNQDLQKIVAFSGAFEKLLEVVDREGGVEGGIVVQDGLSAMGGLLRYNVSNQKVLNAGLVLGLVRMLIGGPGGGNQTAMASSGVTRCLIELALSSNAPAELKAQAINTLTPIMLTSPINQSLLSHLTLAPLIAVPADDQHPNGGFVRLPMRPAVLALIGSVVEGGEEGVAGSKGLRGRAAGVNMFEAFITGNEDARDEIIRGMRIQPVGEQSNDNEDQEPPMQTGGNIIVNALVETPLPGRPIEPYRILFACLLMAHLIRNSEKAKTTAREIKIPPVPPENDHEHAIADDDEEDAEGLLHVIVGNLMLAQREQADCANRAAKEGGGGAGRRLGGAAGKISREEEDWNRVMVGYLTLLCTWLWESPKTVRAFLDESDLQVLIGPITQSTGVDPLVQGLCAFLLGVCYEFNREPGDVTRATLHPILHSRIGPDQFVSRMARLREDVRFKAVQPDQFDVETEAAIEGHGGHGGHVAAGVPMQSPGLGDVAEDEELEVWFDWAFVDFWKNNYYTIQRAIAIDPDAVRGSHAEDPEAAAAIAALREKVQSQTSQLDSLRQKLANQAKEHETERSNLAAEVQSLSEQLGILTLETEQLRAEAETSQKATADASASTGAAHQAELQALREELDGERKKLEELEGVQGERVKGLQGEIDARGGELEKLRKELAEAREEAEKGKEGGDAEQKRLQQELDEAREEAEKSKQESKEAGEREKTRLEGEVEEARKEVENLREELEKAKKDVETANASASTSASTSTSKKGGKKGAAASNDGSTSAAELKKLQTELEQLKSTVEEEKTKREETEKEHEDLLVLLEELSSKRKRDKERMRGGGLDVSEDEEEDDDDDEDGEEDE